MKPDKRFLDRARADFLGALAASRGAVVLARKGFNKFFKYSLVFAVIVALNGALVAFAEGSNVSPTHPLYSFKRLGENVTLVLAPAAKRPYLHQKFAERRLEEMKEMLSASSTNGTVVRDLDDDFKSEVNEAFESAEKNDVPIDTLSFCSSFGGMIDEQGRMEQPAAGNVEWAGFQKYCGGEPSNFRIELE